MNASLSISPRKDSQKCLITYSLNINNLFIYILRSIVRCGSTQSKCTIYFYTAIWPATKIRIPCDNFPATHPCLIRERQLRFYGHVVHFSVDNPTNRIL